jgi:RNA polymerase sigma-70 factor
VKSANTFRLAQAFADAARRAGGPGIPADAQLEATLQEAMDSATNAWPRLALQAQAFVEFLGEKVGGVQAPLVALSKLHVPDLYFAFGCGQADAAALKHFEERFVPALRALLLTRTRPELAEDALQVLRSDMLVGTEKTMPAILAYSGRGALGNWFRVSVIHVLHRLHRRVEHQVQTAGPDELLGLPAVEDDPELHHLKTHYRAAFSAAFDAAVTALSDREKALLRFHYLEGLSTDLLGRMYGVHKATAARWVAQARDGLLMSTRRLFAERSRLSTSEVDSLMRLVRSKLNLSLRRVLGGNSTE